ncbi:MAG: hypothetical protein WDO72_05415 [Pseudomonadota bacterium]
MGIQLSRRYVVAMSLIVIGSISSAMAQSPFAIDFKRCPLERAQLELPIQKIPVGCEVVDCCPGCPGPGPIDMRIRFTAPEGTVARLQVKGVRAEMLKALKITGNAKLEADTLLVSPGQASISGWSSDARGVPILTPQIQLPEKLIKAFTADEIADKADASTNEEITFTATQYLGDFTVRDFGMRYQFPFCRKPPRFDLIRITNNTSGSQALSLLDARRISGCVNDEPERGNPVIIKGSVLSNQNCRSEVGIFSLDNAVKLKENVNTWTDNRGDVTPVAMSALVTEPVTFWVIQGPFSSTQTRITTDVARANQLYNQQEGGIRITTTAVHDATADPDAPGLLNSDCDSVAALTGDIGFTAGELNVYYNDTSGARGWWCGGSNGDVLIISSAADNESLAHEIGHAFSLRHSNTVAGMPATNIMITGGTGRNSFSIGQMFRTSINSNSRLNVHGRRPGEPTRSCPDATANDACPSLAIDP